MKPLLFGSPAALREARRIKAKEALAVLKKMDDDLLARGFPANVFLFSGRVLSRYKHISPRALHELLFYPYHGALLEGLSNEQINTLFSIGARYLIIYYRLSRWGKHE